MKRNHTKLICDVGELSGIFVDTTSLEAFLQKIVERISAHMHSDVCSIYLYYENTKELVLKATKGLSPDSIGKVKLKLGEGLTGLAVKEMRPICEKNASNTPGYRYFPDIGEESYESFLVVPIVRGQTRIGAMVVQNAQKNYFNEEDVQAFRAITSQLANTIETAKLLMSLHEKHEIKEDVPFEKELKFIKGEVGSPGLAFAEAVVFEGKGSFLTQPVPGERKQYTLKDFYRAVHSTEKQLKELQYHIEEKFSDVPSLIFTAQLLMLKDKDFVDRIVKQIQDQINAADAIMHTVKVYVRMFEDLPNTYLREKKEDVKDVGKRLLENLTGLSQKKRECRNRIVIALEMYPSDILELSTQGVKGLILLSGGTTSHLCILARSLEIPLIIAETQQLLRLPPKKKIILDAEGGTIYLDPPREVKIAFKNRQADLFKRPIKETTETKDGTRVQLLSNINLLCDLKAAHAFKAEGIGLYRTEFPFIVRNDFPAEEEQYVIYKKLVEGMPGDEVAFRTLDIGGDKILSYYDYGKEENPFLGMRSIRFSLKHRDIFKQQLRAILRAGLGVNLKIMFPMISSVDEFLDAKKDALECQHELNAKNIPCHADPKIGMMVELPAVLEIINELAQEADFFSIGSNDFIQYMLAVDRTNEKVAEFYLPHHPSVLRALKRIVDAANRHKKEVSICGDMAHDERYIPFLLGIGIRKFSLDSSYLPKIQAAIERVDLKKAQKATEHLLRKYRISETSKLIAQE